MTTTWRMEYLRDDARPLRRRPPLIRARNAGQVKFEGLAAFPGGWQVAAELGSKYEPPAWATLILEARRLSMTSRDGSIVLAFAAIETLIGEVLPLLKKTKRLPPGLWKWIQDRNNNYLKQPGVDEQLDALMRSLAGISLKDNKVLWTAFQEMRKARNSLVHTGAARTLDGKLVTNAVALELVQRADEIVSWIEARLPANLQRPVISGGPVITMAATLGARAFVPQA
jgi:hypothetical protein